MTPAFNTIGEIVGELRREKANGVSVELLRANGIASPLAFIASMGARGYKLELTGGGQSSEAGLRAPCRRGEVEAPAGVAVRDAEAGAIR